MVNNSQADELKELCSSIGELKSESSRYIKRAEWGEITFESIENEIETVFWLVEQLNQLPIQVLPDQIIANALGGFQAISQLFDRISQYAYAFKSGQDASATCQLRPAEVAMGFAFPSADD